MTRNQFDARFTVERLPQWHVRDNVERKIEAGPFASERTAREVLTFMRAHTQAE